MPSAPVAVGLEKMGRLGAWTLERLDGLVFGTAALLEIAGLPELALAWLWAGLYAWLRAAWLKLLAQSHGWVGVALYKVFVSH